MTKKNLGLLLVVIVLATVYIVYFTQWFRPQTVRIFSVNRNLRAAPLRGNLLPNLNFVLSRPLRLTELKVVSLAGLATNKATLPVWHLISDSKSVPTKMFFYGQPIGGMRPYLKGVRADELETNVPYRLLISAGRVTGQNDFELK